MSTFGKRAMQDVHVSDWSQASPATKLLAAVATMLILGGVYLIYLATSLMEWQGPVSIAKNADNSVLVATYNRLFLIDPQNHLSQFRASDLGIVGPVNSVDVDQGQWLLGDDDTGQFFLCAVDLKSCRPRFPHNKDRMFTRAHGVAFIDNQMIVTDSDHHRLRVFDSAGREVLVTRTEPVALCYPNSVVALDGYLYVTDTNNLRIARIDPQNNYHSETFIQTAAGPPFRQANCVDVSSHVSDRGDAYVNLMLDSSVTVSKPALPPARPHHIFPASLLHSSRNQWWVIQMKGMMTQGDVILYSSDGIPLKRVALPDDAEPTSMLEHDDSVLITDPTLGKIFDVSLDGELKGEWGPQTLRDEFTHTLRMRHRWESFKPIGWILISLGLVAAIVVIIRELIRAKGEWNPAISKLRPPTVAPAALHAPETWLSIQPEFARQFRVGAWLTLGLMIALSTVEGWMLFNFMDVHNKASAVLRHRLETLIWMMVGIIAVAAVFAASSLYRRSRQRMGTNGKQLLFDPGNGDVLRSDFPDVLASRNMLLLGRRIINVYTKRGKSLYPPEHFNALILARIPAANFVSSLRFWLAALQRGNMIVWCMVVFLFFIIVTQLFPGALSPLHLALKK